MPVRLTERARGGAATNGMVRDTGNRGATVLACEMIEVAFYEVPYIPLGVPPQSPAYRSYPHAVECLIMVGRLS